MKTKIVATVGPSSESPEVIHKLVAAGMDIARMNFSHCTPEEYRSRKKNIAAAAKKEKRHVTILQDLQGPRIRVGSEIPKEGRPLAEKEMVIFSTEPTKERGVITIDHPYLHSEIKAGEPMYLANGQLELIVRKVKGKQIETEVIRGGMLFPRKAVNVPHTKLSISGLTAKDKKDLKFSLSEGVDYVGISFVQSADDIRAARKIIGTKAKIVAKIETAFALRDIDDIIKESDAIMVARGDLGIEVPEEKVPFIQKNLIRHAAWHGKGSIVATQMLLSMVDHAHPTRAEVSDVANAVWDGADAVMLSDETANGQYPVAAIKAMARIAKQAETFSNQDNFLVRGPIDHGDAMPIAIR